MTEYALVDTNVLIVASAEHPDSPFARDKTPLEDPLLRRRVLDWLIEFEDDAKVLLLDKSMLSEYNNKLGDQDYGLRVIMHKLQTCKCEVMVLEKDANENAVIPERLEPVIHDLADRKWVAASLKATEEGLANKIINACDTDWLEWEEALEAEGIQVFQIIEEWCRAKFHEKQFKKNA